MNIELNNKKILVTGGAGFIGTNLCEALLEKGNKVVCLDNFATGKRENIEKLLKNTDFTLIEGDIRKIEDCLKATKDVDYVLHQAALGSVPRSIKDPITSNNVNVSGFLNMLVAARDNKVKRFVFLFLALYPSRRTTLIHARSPFLRICSIHLSPLSNLDLPWPVY